MVNPKLKYLEDVPWDNSLKLSNGKTVHGLEQLPMVIKFSDDEVFYSHVTENKNDLANWIRDVIGDSELAAQLLSIKTKEEFLKFMDKAISDIKNYKAPEPVVQPVVPAIVPTVVLPTLQPIVSSVVQPVVQPVVPIVSQSVVPSVVQSVVPSVPQPSSPTIVFPTPQHIQEPLTQPTSPHTQQQVEQLVRDSAPKNSPFVSESQMVDVPQPTQQIPSEVAKISNTIPQPIEKPAVVSVDRPIVSSLDKPTILTESGLTPVTVMTPNNGSFDKPTTISETVSAPVEETFEFEEIFKVLIGELEQEVYEWDAKTS